jgi:predicted transcriptional regulator of viral defense system
MKPLLSRQQTALALVRRRGILRTQEAERLERGLYGLPAAAVREHIDLEIVAKRVPQAVFCLLTALRLHGLGTQQPRRVWICLPRGAHTPTLQPMQGRLGVDHL